MGGWYQSSMLLTLLLGSVIVKTVAAGAGAGAVGANASIVLLPSLLNESFVFDGASSSDLARQFYQRYARGDVAEPMNSTLVENLPDAVTKRLLNARTTTATTSSSLSMAFELLPGLLQRALVWDSGFVLDAKPGRFVRIWTTQGRSMAEIMITKQEVATITAAVSKAWQCTWTNCTQPNNATAYKAFDCKCGDTVELLVKCAVVSDVELDDGGDNQDSDTQSSLLWATGADPEAIPVPSISKYQCQSTQATGTNKTQQQSSLLSIHTARQDYASCSSTRFDSLVIPCLRMNSSSISATRLANMKEPKPSAWVDTWLKSALALQSQNQPPRTSASSSSTNSTSSSSSSSNSYNSTQTPDSQQPPTRSSFKMVLLLPIVLGSLFVIAVIGFFLIRRTGSSGNGGGQRGATTNSSIDITALLDPDSKDYL